MKWFFFFIVGFLFRWSFTVLENRKTHFNEMMNFCLFFFLFFTNKKIRTQLPLILINVMKTFPITWIRWGYLIPRIPFFLKFFICESVRFLSHIHKSLSKTSLNNWNTWQFLSLTLILYDTNKMDEHLVI